MHAAIASARRRTWPNESRDAAMPSIPRAANTSTIPLQKTTMRIAVTGMLSQMIARPRALRGSVPARSITTTTALMAIAAVPPSSAQCTPITSDPAASNASSRARLRMRVDASSSAMPSTPTACATICAVLMGVW